MLTAPALNVAPLFVLTLQTLPDAFGKRWVQNRVAPPVMLPSCRTVRRQVPYLT